MSTNTAPTSSTNHIPWLDWMRFLAAFLVLLAHLRGQFFSEWSALEDASRTAFTFLFFSATRLGNEAVITFFVLSGYLVGGRMINRVFAGTFNMKRYIADRSSRIYTPLLPAIVLTATAGIVLGHSDVAASSFGSFISLQGTFFSVPPSNGPLWSLTYEVWFYVIAVTLPLVVAKNWTGALVVVSLTAIVFAQLNAYYIFTWLFGALIYPVRLDCARRKVTFAIYGIILTVTGLAMSQLGTQGTLKVVQLGENSAEIGLIIFAFGFALLLGFITSLPVPQYGVFAKLYNFGMPLAGFSYSTYLFHYPLLHLFVHFTNHQRVTAVTWSSFSVFMLILFSLLIACYLAYQLFEARTEIVRNWLYGVLHLPNTGKRSPVD
ncbi:acyltransferase family protein [Celeribacter marinus]|uniref:O-antigen acetylase n=1 Tax=Celeribacter marinus TaxID=1397108 RepID=A0A0P0A7X1_9RHOB|nr:acyltransferase [Celeribacter marinus]ALI53970.1 O-antigen acetylase [Celeribacter marinus]SFL02891.1 Peptidoglycan/LPS O-acetylase OafA/YrhL, contains acyltransferase and SGNH-hydrolase domains [Celeribacter marinus]